ncbi:hypothetical protein [Algibacter sp. R77976]|uniref:hypothetical protein n=1 Tax=Algibacter sp. R77976 TaxID=3093873 RepID=UPI0037C6B845
MKRILIIALALVSLQAIAQEKKGKQNKGNRGQEMMNLPAEDIATIQTKKMTLFLDLNKSQQEKIQKINLENATKRKEMMAERKAKKESGEAKKPTPEQRLEMENARLDHKIAMKAKMKDILNEDQYVKWEKSLAKKGKKGKDRKKGMKKDSRKEKE